MSRKHAQTPLHKMWHCRVEGQIRSAMKDHPDWFTGMPEHGVRSIAKRIVGEIVAAIISGDDRECSGFKLGHSRGDDVPVRRAPSAEGSGGHICSLPHAEADPMRRCQKHAQFEEKTFNALRSWSRENGEPRTDRSMTTDEYLAWLQGHEGYTEVKLLGDFCYAGIRPLIFHWTLIVGLVGDTNGYADRWCYATEQMAKEALSRWNGDGEPTGWHRHPATGRRRPNGHPDKEYIAE